MAAKIPTGSRSESFVRVSDRRSLPGVLPARLRRGGMGGGGGGGGSARGGSWQLASDQAAPAERHRFRRLPGALPLAVPRCRVIAVLSSAPPSRRGNRGRLRLCRACTDPRRVGGSRPGGFTGDLSGGSWQGPAFRVAAAGTVFRSSEHRPEPEICQLRGFSG